MQYFHFLYCRNSGIFLYSFSHSKTGDKMLRLLKQCFNKTYSLLSYNVYYSVCYTVGHPVGSFRKNILKEFENSNFGIFLASHSTLLC